MAVEQLKPDAPQTAPARSEQRFPAYALADSIVVSKAVFERGGGSASADHLAAYLDYKGTNNGAYLARVSAARSFGLIAKNGNLFVQTPLANRILQPIYDSDRKTALVEAFLNIPLFRAVYDDFRGKELPPEFGMKNALRHKYGIVASRIDLAYRTLMDSAEAAGFFETKMGARTHLILPAVPLAPSANITPPAEQAAFGGGGDDGGDGNSDDAAATYNRVPATPERFNKIRSDMESVKAKYVESLIRLFEEKSAKGELDDKLMERIERLLGV